MISDKYVAIGVEKITVSDNSIQALTIPANTSAATVSAFGGMCLYSVTWDELPTANFGRPLPDGQEVVLINVEWLRNFRLIRAESATIYVYVTYYKNA